MNFLPESWKRVRARFLFREVNERGFDLPLASVTAGGGVEYREDLNISVWNPQSDTALYKRVRPGDFVIGLRSFQSGIGHSRIEGLVSPAYTVLRPTHPDVQQAFFRHYFKSGIHISQLENVAQGIRQGRTIGTEDFYDLSLPLPSPDEQRAIADFLDAETARIDALMERKSRLILTLAERFLEQVRLLVTGGATFMDPLNVRTGDLAASNGWRSVKIGSDLRSGSGTTPPAGDARYYGSGIPWLVTGDLGDDEVAFPSRSLTNEAIRDLSALAVHPAGSLIVAMYGATVGRMGLTTFPTTVNQACCVLHSGACLETKFLFYWILSHRTPLLKRSVGAGQPNISQEIIRSIRIAAPSRRLQREIVNALDDFRATVREATTALSRQVDLLKERRRALITAAVTGQFEVPGAA